MITKKEIKLNIDRFLSCPTHDSSLCIHCRNITNCEWGTKGQAVKGWVATATTLKSQPKPINSYRVNRCPKFKADRRVQIRYADLSKVVGISSSYLRAQILNGKVNKALNSIGYNLTQIKDRKAYIYIIERI